VLVCVYIHILNFQKLLIISKKSHLLKLDSVGMAILFISSFVCFLGRI